MIYLLATVIGLVVAYLLWFGVAAAIAQATGEPLWTVIDKAGRIL
jgi:hypothetical protein